MTYNIFSFQTHQEEFNTNAALYELYKYVQQYNEELTTALDEDEFARKNRLNLKLEQVQVAMNGEAYCWHWLDHIINHRSEVRSLITEALYGKASLYTSWIFKVQPLITFVNILFRPTMHCRDATVWLDRHFWVLYIPIRTVPFENLAVRH